MECLTSMARAFMTKIFPGSFFLRKTVYHAYAQGVRRTFANLSCHRGGRRNLQSALRLTVLYFTERAKSDLKQLKNGS